VYEEETFGVVKVRLSGVSAYLEIFSYFKSILTSWCSKLSNGLEVQKKIPSLVGFISLCLTKSFANTAWTPFF
jgi:hypothetical protein